MMLSHRTPWIALLIRDGEVIDRFHINQPFVLCSNEDSAKVWHVFHRLPRLDARASTPLGMAIVYKEAPDAVVVAE
jgi:hypothetical protein